MPYVPGTTALSAMQRGLPGVVRSQIGTVFGEYGVRQMVGRQYSNYEAVTTPSTAILGRILGQGLGTWAGNELRQSDSISQYLANEELERVARQAQENGNKHAAAGIFQALGVRRDEESWWVQGLDAVGDGLGAGLDTLNQGLNTAGGLLNSARTALLDGGGRLLSSMASLFNSGRQLAKPGRLVFDANGNAYTTDDNGHLVSVALAAGPGGAVSTESQQLEDELRSIREVVERRKVYTVALRAADGPDDIVTATSYFFHTLGKKNLSKRLGRVGAGVEGGQALESLRLAIESSGKFEAAHRAEYIASELQKIEIGRRAIKSELGELNRKLRSDDYDGEQKSVMQEQRRMLENEEFRLEDAALRLKDVRGLGQYPIEQKELLVEYIDFAYTNQREHSDGTKTAKQKIKYREIMRLELDAARSLDMARTGYHADMARRQGISTVANYMTGGSMPAVTPKNWKVFFSSPDERSCEIPRESSYSELNGVECDCIDLQIVKCWQLPDLLRSKPEY